MGSSNTYDQGKIERLSKTDLISHCVRRLIFYTGDCVYRKEGKTKSQKTLGTDCLSSIPHHEVYKHKLLGKVHFKS